MLKAWGQERPGDLNNFFSYRESKWWKAQEDFGENRPFDSECGLAAFGGESRGIPVSHCSDAEMCWYLFILIRVEKQRQKNCMWLWSAVIHLKSKWDVEIMMADVCVTPNLSTHTWINFSVVRGTPSLTEMPCEQDNHFCIAGVIFFPLLSPGCQV